MSSLIPQITSAVEGLLDDAVAKRLIRAVGASPGPVYIKGGKHNLLKKINGYNQASQHGIWLVLADLDQDAACAPPLLEQHLRQPAPGMCFRIAVRAVEAWLLADRERIAAFLSVATARIPGDVESLPDPKLALLELAKKSRRTEIRTGLPPRPGSGRSVGPGYNDLLTEFVLKRWNPQVAATNCDSLDRCIEALRRLIEAEKRRR